LPTPPKRPTVGLPAFERPAVGGVARSKTGNIPSLAFYRIVVVSTSDRGRLQERAPQRGLHHLDNLAATTA
ncbi:MAG: hypothetical protein MUF48_24860, partial [Pirellulaceae bacterium]|nr:hypothetical protein [Pirellulaceae bacterium]